MAQLRQAYKEFVASNAEVVEAVRKINQMMVMLIAPFLGKPIPFLPLQLLWLNLLMDGLLGLGRGVEKSGKDTMPRLFYSPE